MFCISWCDAIQSTDRDRPSILSSVPKYAPNCLISKSNIHLFPKLKCQRMIKETSANETCTKCVLDALYHMSKILKLHSTITKTHTHTLHSVFISFAMHILSMITQYVIRLARRKSRSFFVFGWSNFRCNVNYALATSMFWHKSSAFAATTLYDPLDQSCLSDSFQTDSMQQRRRKLRENKLFDSLYCHTVFNVCLFVYTSLNCSLRSSSITKSQFLSPCNQTSPCTEIFLREKKKINNFRSETKKKNKISV